MEPFWMAFRGLFVVVAMGASLLSGNPLQATEPPKKEPEQLEPVLSIPGGAAGAVFSSDGKRLVVAHGYGNKEFATHDAETGKELLTGKGETCHSIAFSPDGKLFAVSSWPGAVRLFETTNGRELAQLKRKGTVTHVAFSPDGKRVALADTSSAVTIWDVKKLCNGQTAK